MAAVSRGASKTASKLSQVWTHVRAQPVVIVALSIMLLAALVTVMHAASMRRAVGGVQEAFEQREAVREAFAATVSNPADAVVQRKVRPYVEAGMAQFFSSGSAADKAAAVDERRLFFAPTAADISCDFTTLQADCIPLIDRLTCTDRLITFPGSRAVVEASQAAATVKGPRDSSDCRVFVMDGEYTFSKAALKGYAAAWVPPGAQSDGPCFLVMPRADPTTMLVMLLRPSFVRTDNSRLYYVDYNDVSQSGGQGADGMAYTSWDAGTPTAALRLIPVNNAQLDAAGARDMPTLLQPDLGRGDRRAPLTLHDVVPPSGVNMCSLVMYYLKYSGPNNVGPAMPCGAATLFCRVQANFSSSAVDAAGAKLLTLSRFPTDTDVSVAVGGGPTFKIPALDTGVVVATRVGNLLVAATFTSTRCAIRRWNVGGWLKYTAAKPAPRGAEAALANQLGVYNSACVPCLADVAARTVQLGLVVGPVTSDIERQLNANFGDTLDGSSPMRPGKSLRNGRWEAKYQADCNLVIYDTTSGMPVWDTKTRMENAQPGSLEIDATNGVLSMKTSGGIEYWRSSRERAPPDQGRFRLVLEPTGDLSVRGSYGNVVQWTSKGGQTGVPFLLTFADAAKSYEGAHRTEASYAKAGGPWQHYSTFGQTAGYTWPGPGP
jgi:hypothetical protein